MAQLFLDTRVFEPLPVTSNHRRRRSAGEPKEDFSTLVFWMLLVMGLGVLGACIVTPAWLNCQHLAAQRQELTRQLQQLRISNYRYQEAIEAAQHDVAFNERLLIEQLNYHRPGEQALLVGFEPRTPAVSVSKSTSAEGPVWLRAFAQQDTRSILLVMSTALVLFAFVYYRPNGRFTQTVSPPNIPVRQVPAEFSHPSRNSALNC